MARSIAASSIPQASGITLLQRFTAVSLFTTVAVSVLFGAIAVRVVENYALQEHAHSAAVYVSEFLAPRLVANDFLVRPGMRRVQFEFAMRGLIGNGGILRISVWNRSGAILYSDDPALVGRTFALPPRVQAAFFRKQTVSRILPRAQDRAKGRAMEVYVPVVLRGNPGPVAVYDIVSDLRDLDATLNSLRRWLWGSVVAGIFVLYVALFTIVQRASRDLREQQALLRRAFDGAVRSLARAVNARDVATASHSDRVADLAVEIARAAGLNTKAVRNVRIAASLHDVGKIGIQDDILDKPGPLTKRERSLMQRHAAMGYDILLPVAIPHEIKLAVRHHHERWDGSGYPDGLSGSAIPVAARVIAVADTYGALTSNRPYRPARDPNDAMTEILRCAGSQFDPAIVRAFEKVWQERTKRRTAEPPAAAEPLAAAAATGRPGAKPRTA
jgi:putative nucleotidyltransferase with HDIG domain